MEKNQWADIAEEQLEEWEEIYYQEIVQVKKFEYSKILTIFLFLVEQEI